MPYEDFTSRKWKVKEADASAKCTRGETVTFTGPAEKVIIRCDERIPYGSGTYIEGSNTIERANEYEISITWQPKRLIVFTSKGPGSIGGSWTAEDNIAKPDDQP